MDAVSWVTQGGENCITDDRMEGTESKAKESGKK